MICGLRLSLSIKPPHTFDLSFRLPGSENPPVSRSLQHPHPLHHPQPLQHPHPRMQEPAVTPLGPAKGGAAHPPLLVAEEMRWSAQCVCTWRVKNGQRQRRPGEMA